MLAALTPELRSKLWQHWDKFQAEAPPLTDALQQAEQNFEACLNDSSGDSEEASLLALLDAGTTWTSFRCAHSLPISTAPHFPLSIHAGSVNKICCLYPPHIAMSQMNFRGTVYKILLSLYLLVCVLSSYFTLDNLFVRNMHQL